MKKPLVHILTDGEGNLYAPTENPGEYSGLVFDHQTKVIYYMLQEKVGTGCYASFTGHMAPYISENGKFCRFIDNKIVEIG